MFRFDPPENIRKAKIFWYLQGESNRKLTKNEKKKRFLKFLEGINSH